MPYRYSFIAGLVSLALNAAAAQETAVPEHFAVCAGIRNDVERLACYDRAVHQLAGGEQPKLTPEALFGMKGASPPRIETAKPAPEREEVTSIDARVKAIRGNINHGGLYIELDNGQTWIQERGADLLLRAGDPVKISRAALDSFKLSGPNRRFARVRRIE